jgi:hypothetical protein
MCLNCDTTFFFSARRLLVFSITYGCFALQSVEDGQGLEVSEIVVALGVKQRSVYNYLSRRAACNRKKRYCTSEIV